MECMFMYAVVQRGFWDTWAKQAQWPPLKEMTNLKKITIMYVCNIC